MAGIALGFLAEGVGGDDRFPFLGGPNEEVRLQTELLFSFRRQHAFHRSAGSRRSAKDDAMATWLWLPRLTARRRARNVVMPAAAVSLRP